ncbi:MAG TPA: CapA family protein [Candidatus Sulfotelmatobacter sp.]|nr:CapA family protein [Candidatus Sulfotelmatobacter sp.]
MPDASSINLFLCGDVMTGRGIDQILPYPSNPVLHEPYVKDAREYVKLAERVNGTIPRSVEFSYIWGNALSELNCFLPDLRLINLETSITTSDEYWKGKGINYRMNPANIDCLTAASIDYCSIANNHVLDWGYSGFEETIETLRKANISFSGAGENVQQAESPAILDIKERGRVLIYSFGSITSGAPSEWAASTSRAGINLLEEKSFKTIKKQITAEKRTHDVVVFSVHWGANWGYDISFEQQDLAHRLIQDADVDVVWGHSSHHVKGFEVYNGKLILYGCGDFLNDYEGIDGYEEFRTDLSLMYFVKVKTITGRLRSLKMIPTQVKRFKINPAQKTDAFLLYEILNREGKEFASNVELSEQDGFNLLWKQ